MMNINTAKPKIKAMSIPQKLGNTPKPITVNEIISTRTAVIA